VVEMGVRVAINGFGTIGKRVADAVAKQGDMILVGIYKNRPNYEAYVAYRKGYPIYTSAERVGEFEKRGIPIRGTLEDLLGKVDVVIDTTPSKVGESYRPIYEKHGVRMIFQGGEKASIAEISFNALVNYDKAIGARSVRVVSCNTMGLVRIIKAISNHYRVEKVRAYIVRRAADPKEISRGPINAIVLDPPKIPSHHADDVKSVLGDIDIVTMAVAAPTTLMHVHMINMRLSENTTRQRILDILGETPRIATVSSDQSGITSTAEIIEVARDMGRPRGDVHENVVWEESIDVRGNEVNLIQAIHQEAIVVPENIDAIRAIAGMEKDWRRSITKTDSTLGIVRTFAKA
jgi:glyceraldehyde-3-phosphate dehydrogenase (NAD(P))